MIEKIEKISKIWNWIFYNCKIKGKQGDYVCVGKGEIFSSIGVAVFIIDKNKNIALIKNYRHAINDIKYEIVRGGCEKGIKSEDNALKEVQEEIGIKDKPLQIIYLGKLAPDSGLIAGFMDVYLIEFEDFSKYDIWGKKDGNYEDIYKVIFFSEDEFKKLINDGEIIDAYTLSAYSLVKLKKYL